ncbi:MAG: hypothetical protein K8U57_35820 [Planctomycetes bacterium]|nr:hypothetical protein [Planctomycetota bacterium]
MRKEENQGGFLQDTRQFVGLLSWLAAIAGAWLEPFLRKPGTWGEKYCGLHMVFGVFALFVVPPLIEPLPPPARLAQQVRPDNWTAPPAFQTPWLPSPGTPPRPVLATPAKPGAYSVQAMLVAVAATVVMLLVHRVKGIQLRWRGYETHSQYSGEPWLKGDERRVKSTYEPALCILAGGALMTVSFGLGMYAIVGAIGLSFTAALQEEAAKSRRRRMRDAMLEQQLNTRDMP